MGYCHMTAASPTLAEMPSGKDEAYENFPVGSWILPANLRPHIAAFYAFARAIDDIADSSTLSPNEKIERLDGFKQAVEGRETDNPAFSKAHAMRRSLVATGTTSRHCTDLIAAFKQDAVKLRYEAWNDLIGYCLLSASPVGRYLLDLHGGSADGYGPSDALCNALQVINHLQDCQDDYRTLDRVYLPMNWMRTEGARVEDLDKSASSKRIRRVVDHALDETETLLHKAAPLPKGLASRRLAMESAAILDIAWSLVDRLRREDPLASRVKLTKPEYIWCCIRGAVSAMV